MKRLYSIAILLILHSYVFSQTLDNGIDELSKQIVKGMSESNRQKIAVIEFSDLDGKITELGKFLSEELITKLFNAKKFNVVERQLLNKIIKEHRLNVSGLVDENTAKQLGKILGVDAICSGTITDLVESIRVNARIISTETGEVINVASASFVKDDVVRKLMSKVTPTIVNQPSELTSNVSGTFFNENFFKYEFGDPLSEWGDNLGVYRNGLGQKALGSQIGARQSARYNVYFPSNFTFQFSFTGVDCDRPENESIVLKFYDSEMNYLVVNISTCGYIKINLPGLQSQNTWIIADVDGRKLNRVKVTKKNNVFKVYVDDKFITSGTFNINDFRGFEIFSNFSKIKFNNFLAVSI